MKADWIPLKKWIRPRVRLATAHAEDRLRLRVDSLLLHGLQRAARRREGPRVTFRFQRAGGNLHVCLCGIIVSSLYLVHWLEAWVTP